MKAIIIDLDGVLINSHPLKFKAYKEAFSEFGFDLHHSDWSKWVEKGQTLEEFIKKNKIECDSGLIYEKKVHIYFELIKKELILMPGVETFLENCSQKFKLYVISSSHKNTVNIILETQGIKDHFKGILTEEDVQKPRPASDIFIDLLSIIDKKKEDVICIETTPKGLTASKDIGLKCIIVPDPYLESKKELFQDADFIADNIDSLTPELLKKLIKG